MRNRPILAAVFIVLAFVAGAFAHRLLARPPQANALSAQAPVARDAGAHPRSLLRLALTAKFPEDSRPATVAFKLPPTISTVQKVFTPKINAPGARFFESAGEHYVQFSLVSGAPPIVLEMETEIGSFSTFQNVRALPTPPRGEVPEPDARWLAQDRWEGPDAPQIIELARSFEGTEAEDVTRGAIEVCHKRLKPTSVHVDVDIREALKTGEGDCSEYTDLFVSLCRVHGVAARPCFGYASINDNPLEPHGWAEVWDRRTGRWVTVEPIGAAADFGAHDRLYGRYILIGHERNDPLLFGSPVIGWMYHGGQPEMSLQVEEVKIK